MDIDYFEGMMNESYDVVDNAQFMNNYSFNIGDIIVDIDKESSFIEETNVFDESNINSGKVYCDNSSVNSELIHLEQVHCEETQSFIDNSQVFEKLNSFVDNTVVDYSKQSGGVTVNFNAYNEIRSSGSDNDVDSIITAFGEKLAQAVASASEGVHL